MSGKNSYRKLVQLVERRSPKPDVVSSNLTFPAMKSNAILRVIYLFKIPSWDFFSSKNLLLEIIILK